METKHTCLGSLTWDKDDDQTYLVGKLPNGDSYRVAKWLTEQDAKDLVRAGNSYYDMLDALKGLLEHIDKGDLVRNIAGDGASDWAIKTLPLVLTIKKAQAAIAKAEGK